MAQQTQDFQPKDIVQNTMSGGYAIVIFCQKRAKTLEVRNGRMKIDWLKTNTRFIRRPSSKAET